MTNPFSEAFRDAESERMKKAQESIELYRQVGIKRLGEIQNFSNQMTTVLIQFRDAYFKPHLLSSGHCQIIEENQSETVRQYYSQRLCYKAKNDEGDPYWHSIVTIRLRTNRNTGAAEDFLITYWPYASSDSTYGICELEYQSMIKCLIEIRKQEDAGRSGQVYPRENL